MALHPGEKVLRKIRTKQRNDLARGINLMPSQEDQWRLYALAMARKNGTLPSEGDFAVFSRDGQTFVFSPIEPHAWSRRYDPGRIAGEYRIPDRVITYRPDLYPPTEMIDD